MTAADLTALREIAARIDALHNNASVCLKTELGKLTADRCAIEADAVRAAIVEIESLRDKTAKFSRLLTPVWMDLVYRAMGGHEIADDVRLFNFMGGGGSDFSTVGDFREVMGDEREAVAEAEATPDSAEGCALLAAAKEGGREHKSVEPTSSGSEGGGE